MDPKGVYFGKPPRLFTRDNTPVGLKDIKEIFPFDTSQVLIVDDRDEMWHPKVRTSHVLKVSPFLWFANDARAGSSLEGSVANWQQDVELPPPPAKRTRGQQQQPGRVGDTPSGESSRSDAEADDQLLASADILRRVHRAVFAGVAASEAPAVSDVVLALR